MRDKIEGNVRMGEDRSNVGPHICSVPSRVGIETGPCALVSLSAVRVLHRVPLGEFSLAVAADKGFLDEGKYLLAL